MRPARTWEQSGPLFGLALLRAVQRCLQGGLGPVVAALAARLTQGRWRGSSLLDVNQARRLVCRGYAVASIDYRLSDAAVLPAQIHDVKAAVRFLRANASSYNLDPARFAAFGSSAGGHHAALAGTSQGVAGLEDPSQGNGGVSSAVQAVVDCDSWSPAIRPRPTGRPGRTTPWIRECTTC
ncbi:MAG: alpha/beta hydrolase [Myxococcaceae bacterium]|nr:MAG: alpha/beta hydrolase [Myxococcaceae bacterium]